MKEVIAEIKGDQIRKLAAHGQREDGRGLMDFRELAVEPSPVSSAEGSARVKLGKTDLIVGVKMSVGTPYLDHPDEGVLVTNVEMKPMSHPSFDTGAPRPSTIEMARVIDRGIRESKMIDLEGLCIEPGEKVWLLNIDVHAIDFDGNVIDASTIGANVALRGTIVPASKFDLGDDFPMTVREMPVSTTFVKVDDFLLVDPTHIEEAVADARLTITTDNNGDIRAMQKGLSGAFDYDQISSAIDRSVEIGKILRQKMA